MARKQTLSKLAKISNNDLFEMAGAINSCISIMEDDYKHVSDHLKKEILCLKKISIEVDEELEIRGF